jgi:hypothetical protein
METVALPSAVIEVNSTIAEAVGVRQMRLRAERPSAGAQQPAKASRRTRLRGRRCGEHGAQQPGGDEKMDSHGHGLVRNVR